MMGVGGTLSASVEGGCVTAREVVFVGGGVVVGGWWSLGVSVLVETGGGGLGLGLVFCCWICLEDL